MNYDESLSFGRVSFHFGSSNTFAKIATCASGRSG